MPECEVSSPVCFIDCETTGLDHRRHVPWEVSVIHQDGETMTAFVVLGREELADADPFALDIGRFHERHPSGNAYTVGDGTPLRDPYHVAKDVARMTDGAHLVGACPWFDEQMLRKLCYSQGFQPRWHYHLIDVESLAVGYLSAAGVQVPLPWKSDDLSRLLGLPILGPEAKHTAYGDAIHARSMYLHLVDMASAIREEALG